MKFFPVTGLLFAAAAGAWITLTGKFLGRQVYYDSHNVCILLYEQGGWCPVPVTMTFVTICLLIKSSIPANVDINLTINVANGNNHILFCRSESPPGLPKRGNKD
ncbi:MAG: hypothetical protein BYD32DRAFT_464297 [Podila humilis]|nr:MAG: hypothetical protein BYD32DRAFT_464297 [Podila humilis]